MLKIRDDVDLKELEKFGFFKDYLVDTLVYRRVIKKEIGLLRQECEIIIWKEERIIDVYTTKGLLDDVLYDLIKAGLVVKISSKGVTRYEI